MTGINSNWDGKKTPFTKGLFIRLHMVQKNSANFQAEGGGGIAVEQKQNKLQHSLIISSSSPRSAPKHACCTVSNFEDILLSYFLGLEVA